MRTSWESQWNSQGDFEANGDFTLTGNVQNVQFEGFDGLQIDSANLSVEGRGDDRAVEVNGTGTFLGQAVDVQGRINSDKTGQLELAVDKPLNIHGFSVEGQFVMSRSLTDLQLEVSGHTQYVDNTLSVEGSLSIAPDSLTGSLTLGTLDPGLTLGAGPISNASFVVDGMLTLVLHQAGFEVNIDGQLNANGINQALAITGTLDSTGSGQLTVNADDGLALGSTGARIGWRRNTAGHAIHGRVTFVECVSTYHGWATDP